MAVAEPAYNSYMPSRINVSSGLDSTRPAPAVRGRRGKMPPSPRASCAGLLPPEGAFLPWDGPAAKRPHAARRCAGLLPPGPFALGRPGGKTPEQPGLASCRRGPATSAAWVMALPASDMSCPFLQRCCSPAGRIQTPRKPSAQSCCAYEISAVTLCSGDAYAQLPSRPSTPPRR